MNVCIAIKKDGTPCKTIPMSGSDYCFFHDPTMESERKEAASKGGARTRTLRRVDYLLITNGHMISDKKDVCILCGDYTAHYCPMGIEQDDLVDWMDKHPYVYVFAVDNHPAINDNYGWYGVRDTREVDCHAQICIFTDAPAETDPKLPKPDAPEPVSTKSLIKALKAY